MATDLFQAAAQNPELIQEIATAISSVSAPSIVQLAAQDSEFKSALATALQGVAAQHGLSFTVQAAASLEAAGQAFAAIAKFKAHKDNPTQIPIGTPIALMFVAAALLFLPTILSTAGVTMFGDSEVFKGVEGI